MKTILQRLSLETPVFFKKLRALGLSVSSIGTALVSIPGVPSKVNAIGAQLIWIGLTVAAVAQLTVKNPEQINNASS